METVSSDYQTGINKLYHVSVLKDKVLDFLEVKEGKQYIDATLGGGGHSWEILNRGGKVLGIDVDQDALDYVKKKVKTQKSKVKIDENLILVKGNFKNLGEIAEENGFRKVAGIIFDLGTSRYQLTGENRGFSFRKNEALDMRMDKNQGITAKELVNRKSERELYEIFTKFGEEKCALAISHAVISARRVKPIETTGQLAEIVRSVKKSWERIDAATQVFQALRIAVNEELENLKTALIKTRELLAPGGKLAVISFHSLEDRIVKNYLREQKQRGFFEILTKKPIKPDAAEIKANPAARSAKLRIAEKR